MKDIDDKMKILFLCHGNICRSQMAEFVMKELVRRAGCDDIEVESAAIEPSITLDILNLDTVAKPELLRQTLGTMLSPR